MSQCGSGGSVGSINNDISVGVCMLLHLCIWSGAPPRPAPSTHHHQHCANGDGQVCHGGSVLCPTWVTDGWNCPNQHNLVSRLPSATEEKWKYVNSSSVNWQHDIGVKIFGGVKIFLHWSVSNCNNLRRCGNTLWRAAYL